MSWVLNVCEWTHTERQLFGILFVLLKERKIIIKEIYYNKRSCVRQFLNNICTINVQKCEVKKDDDCVDAYTRKKLTINKMWS